MAADLRSMNRNDAGAAVSGALAALFTFIGAFITLHTEPPLPPTIDPNGYTSWDGIGALGSALIWLALVIVAIRIFAPDLLTPRVPWHYVVAALAGVGTLILIVKGLTFGVDGPASVTKHVDVGVGWSGWVLFVLGIAFTVFACLGSGSESYAEAVSEDDAEPEPGSRGDGSSAEDAERVDVDQHRDRGGDEQSDEADDGTGSGDEPAQEH